MPSRRLVTQVYAFSRARYEAGEQSRWCKHTHALLTELGMEDLWLRGYITQKEEKNWDSTLRAKIHTREEEQWKERSITKPKLRTYNTFKHSLSFEEYLTHDNKHNRQTMTRMRGGTNELRIETGRYANTNRDRRLEIEERRCLLCMSGEIEDEKHFLLDCIV